MAWDEKCAEVPEDAAWTEDQVVKFLLANGAKELPGARIERLAAGFYRSKKK